MKSTKRLLARVLVFLMVAALFTALNASVLAATDVAQGKAATASSTLSGYPAGNANDGNASTVWCASGSSYPQWWRVDLGQNYDLTGTSITLAPAGASFKYRVEVSTDGSNFTTKADKTSSYYTGVQNDNFTATARYIRVTFTGSGTSDWASLSDVKAYVGGSGSSAPNITGRVVYHNYNSYGDGTSKIYILNLGTKALSCISSGWTNVIDPMNAVWSADGSKVVFMGIDKSNGSWDLYSYAIGSGGNPVNLTNSSSARDEDPKFYPGSNSSIVFKSTSGSTYYLKTMDLSTGTVSTVYSSTSIECSMPYYSASGSTIYFSGLASNETDIYSVPASGGAASKVSGCSVKNAFEYYPITRDSTGFYFTKHTNSDPADQIYFKNTSSGTVTSMPFNVSGVDNSDACVVDSGYTIISSTRTGGKGEYDLYICDNSAGTAWSLNSYNSGANTSLNELGACYTPTAN